MYIYINKEIPNSYFEIDKALDSEGFNLGTTYQDYLDNKFVLLSDEQIIFHNKYPEASVEEVYNMKLNSKIEKGAEEKILLNYYYNNAKSTPCVIISDTIETFVRLTQGEIDDIIKVINAKKILSIKDECVWFLGEYKISMIPDEMEKLISQICLYINECDIVYKDTLLKLENKNLQTSYSNDYYESIFPKKIILNIDKYVA